MKTVETFLAVKNGKSFRPLFWGFVFNADVGGGV